MANFVYVRQKGPYGNATPLLSAAHLIGDEPFIYKWADDFFTPEANSTKQMIQAYEKYGGGVFACKRATNDKEYDSYGFAAGDVIEDGVLKMSKIVEKPGKDNAPSELASVSNYLLPGEVMRYVERAVNDHSEGEFTFQPFVQQMIDDGHSFYAKEIENAEFHDTGNPLEYIKTTIDFGLKHPEFGEQLKTFLANKLK